ncbi:succinyl-diaminopimelate desuccinylase [Phenylobacterium sp.]|jgi:succinyl-diaminopimelate desuccinylase|uniref:succinyl-diaminopimelate desuccinylase n=1 Tax=Phenylobacterium sp. TaxID=1871053 RepID=UPI0037CAE9A3
MIDAVELTRDLIRRPSVTPADAGAMDIVEQTLAGLGFACRRMKFGEIENLYARYGTARPNLCFAGHTDVVPVGDAGAWTKDAFGAEVIDGVLIGRGAVDMKSAIAAFAAAASEAIAAGQVTGSISFLITGDEEGVATHGTKLVVEALAAEGEVIDHCVVGEPTSAETFGDMVKVGRRGSINTEILVEGIQGHVAYPHRAANPVPVLVKLLSALQERKLDEGYAEFQPSNLEVTMIEAPNTATNVIPGVARARLNIRFNPNHTGQQLADWFELEVWRASVGFAGKITVTPQISGEAFLTERGAFTDLVAAAVADVTGAAPELSTSGGTSDARFIRALCPVIEVGLVGKTMHQVDERAPVEEIRTLQKVYARIIQRYFAPA